MHILSQKVGCNKLKKTIVKGRCTLKSWKRILKLVIGLVITLAIGGALIFAVISYQANMSKSYPGAKYIDIIHKDI